MSSFDGTDDHSEHLGVGSGNPIRRGVIFGIYKRAADVGKEWKPTTVGY